jgi:catechol 2,3-dioxygenase-like lactoylglutathione lyase family enzyme
LGRRSLLNRNIVAHNGGWAGAILAATDVSRAEALISDLPILGLAQVTIKVSDLQRSKKYYGGVLGLPAAFELRDHRGAVSSIYFKVNDQQYVELVAGLRPDELIRLQRLVVESSDLLRLHSIYLEAGLRPSEIGIGADGNPFFRLVAPNSFPIDFIQYSPTSRQGRLVGRLLSNQRVSTHLLHAATMVKDDETKSFFKRLGWGKYLPGARGDFIETPSTDRNLETKNPPLNPDNPETRSQYDRELYGAVYHFSLEMVDVYATRELLKKRGGYDDVRLRTAVGNNRYWLIHLFDPDGTRTEFMSRDKAPDGVPSFSVMPPGQPAAPILATERGFYPWP